MCVQSHRIRASKIQSGVCELENNQICIDMLCMTLQQERHFSALVIK